jgi:hypothetical protein
VAVGHDKLKTQRERPSEDRINRVPVEGHMWPIFTVSDHIEKLLDEEARVCTNVVTVGSLKGGIWTEADNVVLKLLDDEARVYTNMVPVDVKPASAGEGER